MLSLCCLLRSLSSVCSFDIGQFSQFVLNLPFSLTLHLHTKQKVFRSSWKIKNLSVYFFMSFQSLTYGKCNVFTVGKFDQITLANKKVSHPDTQQNIKTVQGTSQTHGLTWPRYFSRASIWELKDVFSKTSLSFKDMSNKPEGCNYFNATGDRYCICTTVIFLYLFMFTSAISISSIPCIDLVPPDPPHSLINTLRGHCTVCVILCFYRWKKHWLNL